MERKPTIIEYYDKVNSVCSFWRGRGVMSELSREGHINIIEGTWNDTWDILRLADIAYFQRPMSKDCLDQIITAKDSGLKCWIDLDDWMDIPDEHPVYKEYYRLFDKGEFKKILSCADIITVTNERMKDGYSKFIDKEIIIIPNALNDYLFKINEISNKKLIVWRGSANHGYDIEYFKEEIIKVMREFPEWRLITIGYETGGFKELKNYQHIKHLNIKDYHGFMLNLNPSIVIAPLKDNEFNRCKSHIVWVEATMAGAVCLSPDFSSCSNAIKYKSLEETMSEVIISDSIRKDNFNISVNELKEKYLLSKVNKQRIEIIKNLVKMKATEAAKISEERFPIIELEREEENRKMIYDLIKKACENGEVCVRGDNLYPGVNIVEELKKDGYYVTSSCPDIFSIYWGEYAERCRNKDLELEEKYEKNRNKKKNTLLVKILKLLHLV